MITIARPTRPSTLPDYFAEERAAEARAARRGRAAYALHWMVMVASGAGLVWLLAG